MKDGKLSDQLMDKYISLPKDIQLFEENVFTETIFENTNME